MKASQKFKIEVENLKFTVSMQELDPAFLPMVARLEREGDLFGPVVNLLFIPTEVAVTISYADKKRGPVRPSIFGYEQSVFMAKQYK